VRFARGSRRGTAQNPKSETRNPKEIRISKSEFGLRASGFLRISDFELRILAPLARFGTDDGTDQTSKIHNVYRPWYDGTVPEGYCAAGAETPNSKNQTPGESGARGPRLYERIKPN